MTKNSLQVNSHRFLGTHFHFVNELGRFLENAGQFKNSTHAFIAMITPMFYVVIAMNDSYLRFTINEILIDFLRKITQYYSETAESLDKIYSQCNHENTDRNFITFVNETQKIYKKTVSDLNKTVATNLIERLHIRHLVTVLNAIRNIILLKMQVIDCDQLTPLICDLDITTKNYLKQLEKMLKV